MGYVALIFVGHEGIAATDAEPAVLGGNANNGFLFHGGEL